MQGRLQTQTCALQECQGQNSQERVSNCASLKETKDTQKLKASGEGGMNRRRTRSFRAMELDACHSPCVQTHRVGKTSTVYRNVK